MGLLDRLLGREDRSPRSSGYGSYPSAPQPPPREHRGQTDDERAVERYRYLLRTAPPEQIERAHAEAFAKLTPQQRQQVLSELSSQVPSAERAGSDDPRDLARMATRAELRQPGTLERSFSSGRGGFGGGGGGMGGGTGMGSVIGGSLLASVAGAFIGTAIADAMFDGFDGGDYAEGFEDGAQADMAADAGDAGYADDAGFADDGGGDWGGGGDFGGGDFDV